MRFAAVDTTPVTVTRISKLYIVHKLFRSLQNRWGIIEDRINPHVEAMLV